MYYVIFRHAKFRKSPTPRLRMRIGGVSEKYRQTAGQTMSEDRASSGPSTDMSAFRELFAKARNIVALSGAGISAESGVPTFRLVQIIHRTWMTDVFVDQRSWRLLANVPGDAAGHARVVCRQPIPGVGILPLPQGSDGEQAPQPSSQGGPHTPLFQLITLCC